MIVLIVVSILVTLAYPSYQTQMIETRRTDGKKALLEIMNLQQKFHARESRYTVDLIGDLMLDDAGLGKVISENNYYLISATVCLGTPAPTISDCVLLTAEPESAQASDGNLTYNSRNVKMPTSKW